MPAPYSNDLREKVMAALDRGEKKSHVSRMFKISRDTIDRGLNRRQTKGSVQAVQGYQRGHSHRIKDWEEFRAFAQQYGDKTQAEMAQLWLGEMSERTSVSCFGTHWLDSKKKTYGYRERDEDKRAAFLAQLAAIPGSQR